MAALIGSPQLIDIVDEAWARDTLPHDSKQEAGVRLSDVGSAPSLPT